MKKGNLVISIVFSILALIIIFMSSSLTSSQDGVPGPGTWPIFISIIMLISAISIGINSLKIKKNDDEALNLMSDDSKRVYFTIAILAVYLVLMYFIGFCVSTFLMLFAFIKWYGDKKWYFNLLISGLTTLIIFLVFTKLLHVPFSFGILF